MFTFDDLTLSMLHPLAAIVLGHLSGNFTTGFNPCNKKCKRDMILFSLP
jgi:hypothetical protein